MAGSFEFERVECMIRGYITMYTRTFERLLTASYCNADENLYNNIYDPFAVSVVNNP